MEQIPGNSNRLQKKTVFQSVYINKFYIVYLKIALTTYPFEVMRLFPLDNHLKLDHDSFLNFPIQLFRHIGIFCCVFLQITALLYKILEFLHRSAPSRFQLHGPKSHQHHNIYLKCFVCKDKHWINKKALLI